MADEGLWAGRYRRERLLGRGAMGEVWAAHDAVLDRLVAIKSIASGRTDQEDLDRMAREARVAARMGHPNAVGVFDLLTVDGRPNLVMEYVEGETLEERIRTRGRLEPHEVAVIGAAVADALAEAHRLGIVHRDIKPANILITPRGTPKLADFGIARAAGDVHLTAEDATIGTPAYLAPEIVQGQVADARSDIWSLGVTLYAALEGSSPFVLSPDDEPIAVLARAFSMPIRPPAAGGALGHTVMAMLDRDPARRPTAAEVTDVLRDRASTAAAGSTQRLAAPRSEPHAAAPSGPVGRRRRWMLIGSAGALVVAVAALLVVVLTRGSGPTVSGGKPAAAGQRYRGPSDITTTGPGGWRRDPADSSVLVADYLAPDTVDRHIGNYFRLGVYSRHADDTIHDTAADARKSVLEDATRGEILGTSYVSFLGTRAVDVEWTAVNPEHVSRHGIVRMWNSGGITREITVNTTQATWSSARPIFEQLTANCRIHT